jgi:hypothetical protein
MRFAILENQEGIAESSETDINNAWENIHVSVKISYEESLEYYAISQKNPWFD